MVLFFVLGCGYKQMKIRKEFSNFSKPMQNKTFFTDAFMKIDKMMNLFKVPSIRIMIKPIKNRTANDKIPFDIRNFIETPLILYISNLNLIAYEPDFREKEMMITKYNLKNVKNSLPDLVINGAITQYDKTMIMQTNSLNLEDLKGKNSTTFISGFGKNFITSKIAIDLKIYKYSDRTYLSGIATQNKIELLKQTSNENLKIILNRSGIGGDKAITFKYSEDEALRILSEYSLLQLLGRLYALPYWKCTKPNLEVDKYVMKENLQEFYGLKRKERIAKIEQLLTIYKPPHLIKDKIIDKIELEEIETIRKKFYIKESNILSVKFYEQLFLKAPFFEDVYIRYKK